MGPTNVVDTNDASWVFALDGDDTICATGASRVDAGSGNDVVDVTAQQSSDVWLGAGADQYVGGPGADRVRAASVSDEYSGPIDDVDADVIDTGDGDAHVRTGEVGVPNPDHITVGNDDADVHFAGHQGAGGFVSLGDGYHRLYVGVSGLPRRPHWILDNSDHRTSPVAKRVVNLEGTVSEFRLTGAVATTAPFNVHLELLGSSQAETVQTSRSGRHVGLELRMRGGNDRLRIDCPSVGSEAVFSGGPGATGSTSTPAATPASTSTSTCSPMGSTMR